MRRIVTDEHTGPACWLGLAATPTFALMALLTTIWGDGASGMHGAAHASSPLTGMATMYWLMSLFHAVPWLRLMARRPFRRIVG